MEMKLDCWNVATAGGAAADAMRSVKQFPRESIFISTQGCSLLTPTSLLKHKKCKFALLVCGNRGFGLHAEISSCVIKS